jgi:hypothetical protein
MGNKTYTVCDAHFFDAGGPASPYGMDENSTITFYPTVPTQKLTALFNSLEIEEGGSNCINDKLSVYDGPSVSDNPVATLCGSSVPQHVTASNPSGALTFLFVSNSTNSGSGWDITMSCDSNVGIIENIRNAVRIYPNPVLNGSTVIELKNPIQMLVVRDMTGRTMSTSSPMSSRHLVDCSWPSGIYLFQIKTNDVWISKKVQVINN